jgi:hypothetical protein
MRFGFNVALYMLSDPACWAINRLLVNAHEVLLSTPGLTRWPVFEADSACGSMVLYDHLYSVFPRSARKNRTPA